MRREKRERAIRRHWRIGRIQGRRMGRVRICHCRYVVIGNYWFDYMCLPSLTYVMSIVVGEMAGREECASVGEGRRRRGGGEKKDGIDELTMVEWRGLRKAKSSRNKVSYTNGDYSIYMCTKSDCAFRLCRVCGEKRETAKNKSGGRSRQKRTKKDKEPNVNKSPCGHEEKCFKKEVNKAYSPRWRRERNMSTKGYPLTCYACGDGL